MLIDAIRHKKNASRLLVISTLFAMLLLTLPLSSRAQDTNSIDTLRRMGKAFAGIAEKASPAVVGIKAEKTVTTEYPTLEELPFGSPSDPFGDDLFDRFFRWRSPSRPSPQRKSQQKQTAQGSGFIITGDGYILTSTHLVGEADKVFVKVGEKPEVEATVKGTDPESDVAVVKIEGDNLPYLELADSDALSVGEWVVAIGNPFGLSHTITAGIVSAKGRSGFGITSYEDFIQTDAAINPGNSGGPLLNLDGKVVGINTFIISRTGGFMGVGFAVPINMAKDIYEQLIKGGKVVRGYLGITYRELTPDLAAALGLKEDAKGVAVNEVLEDSPAGKAGMKVYDVIVEFEGQPVEKGTEFLTRVSKLEPGTKVQMVVLRDGKREKVTVTLGTRPPKEELAAGGSKPSDVTEQLGLTVQTLTDDMARRLNYQGPTGVLVTRVDSGSEAASKGISPGMVILEVNRESVKNTKEFYDAVEKSVKKGTVLLLVTDGDSTFLAPLRLPKK
jgi:serine protease Do